MLHIPSHYSTCAMMSDVHLSFVRLPNSKLLDKVNASNSSACTVVTAGEFVSQRLSPKGTQVNAISKNINLRNIALGGQTRLASERIHLQVTESHFDAAMRTHSYQSRQY